MAGLTARAKPGSMGLMNREAFHVSQFGRRVGTRSEGEAARALLLKTLEAMPDDGQLVVDLDGVEVLASSFADEVIAKSLGLLLSGVYGNQTMIVSSPSEELTEGLADKLIQRNLAMLCLNGDVKRKDWRIVGQLAAPHVETLQLIFQQGETTAKALADTLAIPPNACHQRLKRLAELRLVLQERVGVSAPKTLYQFRSIL